MTEGSLSLQKIQIVSLVFLAILTIGAAVFVSVFFAWSVFVGGVISIGSFWISNSHIVRLVNSVTSIESPEDRKAQAQEGQKGYLLKFWLRIVIIGVVLFLLISNEAVNIFGMILGLSTVVLTVTYISINVAWYYFFRGRR